MEPYGLKDKCFMELISKLKVNLSVSSDEDHSESNSLLDQLNALDYKKPIIFDKQKADCLVSQCCSAIAPSNTFLVAKCCHLVLNLVGRQGLTFTKDTLHTFIEWVTQALKYSADVAFLDILQAVEVVIKANRYDFEKGGDKLLPILLDELETRSSLSDPLDVKMRRLRCLHALARVLSVESIPQCAKEFINILNTQSTSNLLSHAQVWRSTIGALDGLVGINRAWVEESICELLSVVLAGMHLGLAGVKPTVPMQFHPLPSVIQQPLQPRSTLPKINVRGKKRQKVKVKQVGWLQSEENRECQVEKTLSMECFNSVWANSDSDFSDSEGGRTAKLAKEQAHTRHAAINLLIQVVRVCRCRQLYGYYTTLLDTGALLYSLKNETCLKPRIATLAAITALLSDSKPFFAQAQHSEGGSFTAFSGVLSELVYSLHSACATAMSSWPAPPLAVPLLHCTSTLISVTPYHRLKPGLVTTIFKAVHPFTTHRDPTVCVGALQCLTEISTADPSTSEHDSIIATGANSTSLASITEGSWLPSLCVHNLELGGSNETVQVGWWQLVIGLCRCHFNYVTACLHQLQALLLRDLASSLKLVQLYAAKTIENFAAQLVTREELREFHIGMWAKLLEGPMVPILQSASNIASFGCDCLANIGPHAFTSLKGESQILVMTLVYGCCEHEESTVRASAVRTLGMFLLSPHQLQEQYICDINDIVVKALSDPATIVRVKAAWAFGNLVELLVQLEQQDKELEGVMVLPSLLETSLSVMNDNNKVQANMLRAIGTLLMLARQEHLEQLKCKESIEKVAVFLVKSASSGYSMKMRWNACYALASMMRNEELHAFSNKWQTGVVSGLCALLVKCSNFKVRLNACAALAALPKRKYYQSVYVKVWHALLDGFDNATNMPDFREFKHQDSLVQQLCVTLCHLAVHLELEDLCELEDLLVYRIEPLRQPLSQFQESAPPERAGTILAAANHISSLTKRAASPAHTSALQALLHIFTLSA